MTIVEIGPWRILRPLSSSGLCVMGPTAVTCHALTNGTVARESPRPKTPEQWHAVVFSADARRYAAHSGVTIAAMGDASARTITNSISTNTWFFMQSRNDGQSWSDN